MAKTADIGSKRLISLAPAQWALWLTGDPAAEVLDFPSGEFAWVARATDVLIRAYSPRHGTFLIVNEIQFRPDSRMPLRMRAYAALAEERYGLNVFPVVVNLLPPAQAEVTITSYHTEFMGLLAHQDYRVFNLWEVDAGQVLALNWVTLLPFVPILRGGDDLDTVRKALALLRADERLAEMEPLLAFFATFVMTPEHVRQMMRWNMTMLRESPWYAEIEKEGLERGLQQGLQEGLQQGLQEGLQQGLQEGLQRGQAEMLLLVLERRFGHVPADLAQRIRNLPGSRLVPLLDMALTATSLPEVAAALETLPPGAGNGHPPTA